MRKHILGHSGGWLGDHGKYGHSVENHKRRHALPLQSIAGEAKFFARLLGGARKVENFVFITKAVAKNR